MSNSDLLTELFEKDYVTRQVKLSPSLPVITLRSISVERQASVEANLKKNVEELSQRQFVQTLAVEMLAHSLVSWGSLTQDTPEEWRKYLDTKSSALIEKLTKEQRALEQDLRKALNIEDINAEFFEGKDQPGN